LGDRDPEAVHQMRVGLRRLRSLNRTCGIACLLPITDRQIGTIARTLGELRDLDVLGEALCDRYLPQLAKDEQKQLKPVLQRLKDQRKRERICTESLLKSSRYQHFCKSFRQWLQSPRYTALGEAPITFILPDLLLAQLGNFWLHPAWWLGYEHETPDVNLPWPIFHDLRKQAKQIRYTLELFAPWYPEPYDHLLHQVKALQEALGNLQDSQVLETFLQQNLDRKTGRSLTQLWLIFAEERLNNWHQWQMLQMELTQSDQRASYRQCLAHPLPLPKL
jgi:CHAD domain-containing protein